MNDNKSEAQDRIAELTFKVAKLEAENKRLRTIVTREIVPRRQPLREKLRPKIGSFSHYPPRYLEAPPSYSAETAPDPAPSIAIVTPSFNQGDYIGAAIDSVLTQKYRALQYHVQDANSTDRTVRILKSFGGRIGWQSAPDRGQAHGLNTGFRAVAGDIMAYLNSDDMLMPGALAYVARAFTDHPDLDFVYSHRICIDQDGMEIGRWILPRHDPASLTMFDYVPQETMFWRRRVWETLGGFDESFQYALDWDFILRAQAKGMRFARLPRFLGCFRVHDMQKTTDSFDVGFEETKRLRRAHLGYDPDHRTVSRVMGRYLRRHVLYHRAYKLKLLKY